MKGGPGTAQDAAGRGIPESAGALWLVVGAGTAFSLLSLASIGMFTLLPSLLLGLWLLASRLRGAPMFLIGGGITTSILWGLHISSGDTPDATLWPIILGVGLTVLGTAVLRRRR